VLARDPQNAEGLMVDARLKLVKGERARQLPNWKDWRAHFRDRRKFISSWRWRIW